MDPAVPWTAYAASYNRLANAGGGFQTSAGDFQNTALAGHQATAQAQSTTNQLILQAAHTSATLAGQLGQATSFTPTGFLSPPTVGYDFSPLFHHANPKAAAAHFRKQTGESELSSLHQGSYFDPQTAAPASAWTQANSQLPSPFGILPHESVVPNSTGTTKPSTGSYENSFAFTAQSLNHISSHLSDFSKAKAAARNQQQPAAYSNTNQQSCIVSTASSSPSQAKAEYRVPQSPARTNTAYAGQRPAPAATAEKTPGRNFASPPGKAAPPQHPPQPTPQAAPQHVVPKNQVKQPERRPTGETLETSQSSPISFALSYAGTPTGKNVQRGAPPTAQYVVNQNYRYNEGEYHSRKTGSADSAYSSGSNGPECNSAVPRRPSPLQAHSQPSPVGHASSPAYPIYNSPSAVSQVTPPSPLDVTVSRPSTVAYSSVITRADGRWEGEPRTPTQQPQSVAPPRNKFPLGYGLDASQTQRVVAQSLAERQQAYFDTTPSGDLSACRGDPMSLVKNLHNLQNCNPATIPPAEVNKNEQERAAVKSGSGQKGGRRKSGEKMETAVPAELLAAGRVPPPAHHNNPTQQSQNGAYFEMERWNLAAPKMFAGHNHHQGLLAAHPHTHPPPLPYFPPFHIPPGHPHAPHPHAQDFHGGVEVQPTFSENYHHPEQKEENPKVVVPNVEEELRYLSQQEHAQVVLASQQNGTPATTLPPPIRNPEKKILNDPSSGFMASYLKFLQGERDVSPPPPARANRKTLWKNKAYTPEVRPGPPASNSPSIGNTVTTPLNSTPSTVRAVPAVERKGNEKPYNPDDDPRFYPLPKSTAKRKLNDSDSSEDESPGARKTYTQMKTVTSSQLAKLGTNVPYDGPKKPLGRPPSQQNLQRKMNNASGNNSLVMPPRREMSKRKAKDKTTMKNLLEKTLDEEPDVDDPDFVDSDTDPVWMPGAKGDSDDEGKGRKKKMRSVFGKPQGKRRLPEDASSSDEEARKARKNLLSPRAKNKLSKPQMDGGRTIVESQVTSSQENEEGMFSKTGEFVVMKSDLHEEYPPIWRIDGKTLLQKYEPFDENGKTLYRNISTYSGWTPQNRHIYVTVPVRFRVQSRMETIVELMRDQMTLEDPELMQRVMKDLEKYQDSFEVYIQTLISQALDSNFLSEILMEQDEYFLTNVKTIDDVTEDHCRRLLNVNRWRANLIQTFKTYPVLNITQDLPKEQNAGRPCAGCDKQKVTMKMQVFGQPYNPTTLETSETESKVQNDKEFLFCSSCGWRISLFSKASHQKYLMFIECAKRVSEKRTNDPNKDTTLILNELLADETWLTQLFLDVRKSWAEIEKIEHISCESNKQLLQNAVASAGIS